MERIAQLRDNELKHIRFTQLLSSLNMATFQVTLWLMSALFAVPCPMPPELASAGSAGPSLSMSDDSRQTSGDFIKSFLLNGSDWVFPACLQSGPVLVALAAFGVYTAMGASLTAAIAFPALSLFNLLRFPIIMFPSQVGTSA
jgi:hypothetical protein